MDPTATNNPQNNNPEQPSTTPDPQNNPQAPSPIQPGQYVESGSQNQVAPLQNQEPAHPLTEPTFTAPQANLGNVSQEQIAQPAPGAPIVNLAGAPQTQQLPPQNSEVPPPPSGPAIQSPEQTQQPPSSEPKMKKFKLLFVGLAVVVLLGIIGGVAYFFLIANKQEEVKTGNIDQVVEPSPLPKNATGAGFADLPAATTEATTSSGL